MIDTEVFLDALQAVGFKLFTGVPCSYLTSLINRVIDTPTLHYVNATNEGDAVAIAAGAELGGMPAVVMLQNSGLGNAVSPLTSLSAIFQIPVLLIVTWRGQPGGSTDEPQHALMGRITPQCLELMGIPWESLPACKEELPAVLARACASMRSHNKPYALLVPRNTFTAYALKSGTSPFGPAKETLPLSRPRFADQAIRPSCAMEQDEALAAIRKAAGQKDALLATTGYTGRALYAQGDVPNQFYMVGSMGCLSSFGLGLAVARPQARILAIDGDGAVLMRMGAMAAIGRQQPENLVHIVLDNGVHDSTGAQATVSSSVDLAGVAHACSYARAVHVSQPRELQEVLGQCGRELTFIHVRTRPRSDHNLPRPTITPPDAARRFRLWMESTC